MHGKRSDFFLVGAREVGLFYEMFPYPSKKIFSKKDLLKNSKWVSSLTGFSSDSFPAGSRVLEAGCGTGEFSCGFGLSESVFVTGVDLSGVSLEIAQRNAKRFGLKNVSFMKGDVLNLPFKDGEFDFVFSLGCIHHTQNPRGAFAELCRVVKRNGFVVVGVYTKTGRFFTRLKKFLLWVLSPFCEKKRLALANKLFFGGKSLSVSQRIRLADKYLHPLEHHFFAGTLFKWFEDEGFVFVSCAPQMGTGFFERFLTQVAWFFLQKDFFVVCGKKL
jgi:ubiquinone/menaquinone biosynthesis C-methylase UbiE